MAKSVRGRLSVSLYSIYLGKQTVTAGKMGVNERAQLGFESKPRVIKKKTGSSGQKVTERPGEFRMSKTWDHGELQSAPLLERKSKM